MTAPSTEQITALLERLVRAHTDGISHFINRLVFHNGTINEDHLYQVHTKYGIPYFTKAEQGRKPTNYSIMIGGEICNSFCPLYEVAYFLQALVLAGVATVCIENGELVTFAAISDDETRLQTIKKRITTMDGESILLGMQRPKVCIISSLDTDIEPYRYMKHQLWRLSPNVFKKRVGEITAGDFTQTKRDTALYKIYWIDEDEDIAELALAHAETLPQAKTIQYYLTLERLLAHLSISLNNIPFYFNFVPKEEIQKLGPDNKFLQALLELHEPKNTKLYSHIVQRQQPWIVGFSCPTCGESSKKILSLRIKASGNVVRIICSSQKKQFLNESGVSYTRRGCGASFDFPIPKTAHELYTFLVSTSSTINFAARELLGIIRTTTYQPIAWAVTDIAIRYAKGGAVIEAIPYYPKGFGDHRALLTSTLTIQRLFLEGVLAPKISDLLHTKGLLTASEVQIIGYSSPSRLFDPTVPVKNYDGLYASDTSALKILETGIMSLTEFLERSINIHYYSLEQLQTLIS